MNINSLDIFAFFFLCILSHFVCIWNRNQFFIGNTKKVSIDGGEEDSITTIKMVGRQHSLLTGIMDQINVCFSFQVWYKFIEQNSVNETLMTLEIFTLDYGQHSNYICIFRLNILFLLSIHFPTKRFLQRAFLDASSMGNYFSSFDINGHLRCKSSV